MITKPQSLMELKAMMSAFTALGQILEDFLQDREFLPEYSGLKEKIRNGMQQAEAANPWFSDMYIRKSFASWSKALRPEKLKRWIAAYPDLENQWGSKPMKTVAVVMAGNIPMVGLHDLLCVLLSGHRVVAKLSSDDAILLPLIGEVLMETEPQLRDRMHFTTGQINAFDAVIATGSDNTARYFEYYFGKYPHIIRKNRNSIAVLDGQESFRELDDLCNDIFDYFGMGCRSVSKIYVPAGYDFSNLTILFDAMDHAGNHHKYRNNYDYQKSVMMINRIPFIDHRNLLLVERESLKSALSVVHYGYYQDIKSLKQQIALIEDQIQCVVCYNKITNSTIPFGKTQDPELWEYADGVDTMLFLASLAG
jgi:hypothetical protein